MRRNLICSALLFAFVLLANYGLKRLHAAIGFTDFMIFCVVGIGALIATGYAVDAIVRNRSQEVLPPEPRDPRQLEPLQRYLGDAIEHQSVTSDGGHVRSLGQTRS